MADDDGGIYALRLFLAQVLGALNVPHGTSKMSVIRRNCHKMLMAVKNAQMLKSKCQGEKNCHIFLLNG